MESLKGRSFKAERKICLDSYSRKKRSIKYNFDTRGLSYGMEKSNRIFSIRSRVVWRKKEKETYHKKLCYRSEITYQNIVRFDEKKRYLYDTFIVSAFVERNYRVCVHRKSKFAKCQQNITNFQACRSNQRDTQLFLS